MDGCRFFIIKSKFLLLYDIFGFISVMFYVYDIAI